MNILQHGRVIAPKASGYKVSVSALTIIQLFLNSNFTFKRLALTSKRVRAALLTYGLRKNRQLALQVQNVDMPPLSPSTVKQMVQFAGMLKIGVSKGESLDDENWIANLDMLSQKILWAINLHKYDEIYIETRISTSFDVNSLCTQLTSLPEWIFNSQTIKRWEAFSNIITFIEQVQGFRDVEIIDQLFNDRTSGRSSITWSNCDKHMKKHLAIIECLKDKIELLTFKECRYYGICHNLFPYIYPNLRELCLNNAKILEGCSFKKFPQLEVLKVLNPQIQSYRYDEQQKKRIYTDAFKGLTFSLLSQMIYGNKHIKLADIIPSLLHLEADVNFKETLDLSKLQSQQFIQRQQIRMASIALIPQCRLRDYESIFSFDVLYKLLESVSKIENSFQQPPIELRMCKFSDTLPTRYAPNPTEAELGKQLKELANWSSLQITSLKGNGSERFIMQIIMKKVNARELTLYFDGSELGSKFEIFGVKQQISQIAKAKIDSSPIASPVTKVIKTFFNLKAYAED